MKLACQLHAVAAMTQNRVIGRDGTMPWHVPDDLRFFNRLTTGHPILMGRKTFDSIGRPLPNRRNIVITRNPDWRHEGVEAVPSLEAAIALLDGAEGYVIGGADIYRQSLALAQRLIVTEIGQTFDCDAFFPAVDHAVWQETAREAHVSEKSGLPYAFVTLQRKA
ncbi:dihydrofolate reductase [Janthinobacterium sp.]|uniref:dihydrofolate reductase n=1 Tax=Janthinobacterium sp. TaxID=1871054 RepID=UPI00258C13B9|nr:dihydrofolate reductase [Janthinobacterium sp.]MCX7291524.1 dihydrofolate reductase [Janthinobacterium sp.]